MQPATVSAEQVPNLEDRGMAAVRAQAEALATSGLSLFIAGEVGTGRRTLAEKAARIRAGTRRYYNTDPLSWVGLPTIVATLASVVVVGEPINLPGTAQVELALAIAKRRLSLILWGPLSTVDQLEPTLLAHVRATVLALPPLRHRGDDVCRWMSLFAAEAGATITLAEDLAHAAVAYGWPGNLTELRAAVSRALMLRGVGDLRPLQLNEFPEVAKALPGFRSPVAPIAGSARGLPLNEAVAAFKRDYVLRALEAAQGNRTMAAKALGVDVRTVFRVLEEAPANE